MTGLKALYTGQFPLHVAVFGDDHAVQQPVPQVVGRGLGHLPRGLAHRDQMDPVVLKIGVPQGPFHRLVGQDVFDGCFYDPVSVFS